jgi:hypothetical protein
MLKVFLTLKFYKESIMEILSNAYIVAIPVLIFIAFLIIARKDKKEDALLKKRIADSIRTKSKSTLSPSSKETAKKKVSSFDY